MSLKNFRFVPRNEMEWARWTKIQEDAASSTTTTADTLTDYIVTHRQIKVVSNTVQFDFDAGNSALIDLQQASGGVTFSVLNVPVSGYAELFLTVIQGSTARNITWPSSFTWPGGTAPTITTSNDAVDVIHAFTVDGGTTFRGVFWQNFS